METAPAAGPFLFKVWFIGVGSIRAYYHLEERKRTNKGNLEEKTTREVTDWLIPAGGLYTAMRSFSQRVPTAYYVETLEACQLHTLSYQNYQAILRYHSEVFAKIVEYIINASESRLRMCHLRYPEDRLRMFQLACPGKTSHLSVNMQASYLDIDPNTLSRLRKKVR